jgi:hypothetical protein
MSIDTPTLIWLFPIAFMLHDFEELILFEPWLKKNAAEIEGRIKPRVPAFLAKQLSAVLTKSTVEFATPIGLIFALTSVASFLAVVYGQYGFFLLASGSFFLHGFMHLAQAVMLRRYVPAVITSLLIVIPYGLILFQRLLDERLIDGSSLLVNFGLAVALTVPFILVMHAVGDFVYRKIVRNLID